MEKGTCKKCGCTQDNPCYHPGYGTCWWEDENETLCSHCADPEIEKDTEHCMMDQYLIEEFVKEN